MGTTCRRGPAQLMLKPVALARTSRSFVPTKFSHRKRNVPSDFNGDTTSPAASAG